MNNLTRLSILSWLVGSLVAATSGPANASQIYFNDFDGTETFSGGVTGALTGVTTTISVNNFPAPFAGDMLHNNTGGSPFPPPVIPGLPTTLTLSNLPAHTSIDVDFLLAIINTWDGIGGFPNGGSDRFNVLIDGAPVFSEVFAIQSGTPTYAPPAGVLLGIGPYGSVNALDQAYDMTFEPSLHGVVHSANSVTIQWFADGPGWQGATDESWGMDNVRISFTAASGLPGDGNGDGWVDGLDYLLWAAHFGDNPAEDPPGFPANGDYNHDDVVNGLDYLVWAGNFGSHSSAATLTEPGSMVLLLLGLFTLINGRRSSRGPALWE